MMGKPFMLFHARGGVAHEIWQWTMVEREAPEPVKELAIQRVYQGQHMAGVIAPDDVENFERIVEASHSPRTWAPPDELRDPPRPRPGPDPAPAGEHRRRADRREPAGLLPILPPHHGT